jgi:hypothetical protein
MFELLAASPRKGDFQAGPLAAQHFYARRYTLAVFKQRN